jgi:hypothetical protein
MIDQIPAQHAECRVGMMRVDIGNREAQALSRVKAF